MFEFVTRKTVHWLFQWLKSLKWFFALGCRQYTYSICFVRFKATLACLCWVAFRSFDTHLTSRLWANLCSWIWFLGTVEGKFGAKSGVKNMWLWNVENLFLLGGLEADSKVIKKKKNSIMRWQIAFPFFQMSVTLPTKPLKYPICDSIVHIWLGF